MHKDQNNGATPQLANLTTDTCMRTLSGALVDLLAPRPEQIILGDVIRGLTRLPRYVGHTVTDEIWTVSDHLVLSVILSKHLHPKAPQVFHAAVFMHDGHEAYIGDPISPFKAALRVLGAYEAVKRIENGLSKAIHDKFDIPYPLPEGWAEMIKEIDLLSFRIEESHFRPSPVEHKFLPPGLKREDLPLPHASEIERTLRTVNCWQQIMADRIRYPEPHISLNVGKRPTFNVDF